jgi:hypothetical protein
VTKKPQYNNYQYSIPQEHHNIKYLNKPKNQYNPTIKNERNQKANNKSINLQLVNSNSNNILTKPDYPKKRSIKSAVRRRSIPNNRKCRRTRFSSKSKYRYKQFYTSINNYNNRVRTITVSVNNINMDRFNVKTPHTNVHNYINDIIHIDKSINFIKT